MPTQEKIIDTLRKELPYLRDNYNVKRLGLFGSYIRGEQKKNSDVDILVEFNKPIGLFKFMNLEYHLNTLIHRKVDLVMKSALKPRIGRHILKEVKYI